MSTKTNVASRRAALLQELQRAGLYAAVVCSYENVSYLAGTHMLTQIMVPDRLAFVVIGPGEATTLLVCNIEESQVKSQSDISDVRAYVEFEDDPTDALVEVLRDGRHLRSIGYEARRLPAGALVKLQQALPHLQLRAIDDSLDDLQGDKTAPEIDLLKASANATLDAVIKTIGEVDSSHTERGVSNLIFRRLVDSGGDPTFLVFAAGERTMHGHPEPRETQLEVGSLWRTDLGARYQFGFNSDVARSGVVGEPSAAQAETLAALRAAQDAALAIAEPGRPAKELFEACRTTAVRGGLKFTMPHIGHGLGIGLHEQPMLEPRNDRRLRAGMVLNIEPLVIVPERREGYHVEDLVLVSDSGPVLLTEPQRELLRIPAK